MQKATAAQLERPSECVQGDDNKPSSAPPQPGKGGWGPPGPVGGGPSTVQGAKAMTSQTTFRICDVMCPRKECLRVNSSKGLKYQQCLRLSTLNLAAQNQRGINIGFPRLNVLHDTGFSSCRTLAFCGSVAGNSSQCPWPPMPEIHTS